MSNPEEERPPSDFLRVDEMDLNGAIYIMTLSDLEYCIKYKYEIPTKHVRVKFRLFSDGYIWMDEDKTLIEDELKNLKQCLHTRSGTGLCGTYHDGRTENKKIMNLLFKYLLEQYQLNRLASDLYKKRGKKLRSERLLVYDSFSDSDVDETFIRDNEGRIMGLKDYNNFPFVFYVKENININEDKIALISKKKVSKTVYIWTVLKNKKDIGRAVLSGGWLDEGGVALFAEKIKYGLHQTYGFGNFEPKVGQIPDQYFDRGNYTVVKNFFK